MSITSPPVHGIHTWLVKAAWDARKSGMAVAEAATMLYAFEHQLRRPYQRGEVEAAVRTVYRTQLDQRPRQPKAPRVEWNARETARIHREHPATIEHWRSRTFTPEPWRLWPSMVLSLLFADSQALVCAGRSISWFETATLAELGNLAGWQLVVPGLMTARYGTTQTGRRSMHTLDNTGPRRFIVCDFDEPPPEQHPSIIAFLARFREPSIVMSSGGKGIHAWFPVTGSAADDRIFWRLAIGLGADAALERNRSQFVRMPNGTRDNGNHQVVHYLNPRAGR